MELTNKDNVLVLSIGSDENRFNPTLVENIHKQLTIVEQTQGAKALVITAGGKFFSNGLDLQWLGNNRQQAGAFIQELWKLFARILIFPLPTVSVINGHAFGAGFFLALSCDWRVMRKDRGFLNFPEANLGLPLEAFRALVMKLPQNAQRTVLTGEKVGAAEALNYGMVDVLESEENMVQTGIALGLKYAGKEKNNYSVLKMDLWGHIHSQLTHAKPAKL